MFNRAKPLWWLVGYHSVESLTHCNKQADLTFTTKHNYWHTILTRLTLSFSFILLSSWSVCDIQRLYNILQLDDSVLMNNTILHNTYYQYYQLYHILYKKLINTPLSSHSPHILATDGRKIFIAFVHLQNGEYKITSIMWHSNINPQQFADIHISWVNKRGSTVAYT